MWPLRKVGISSTGSHLSLRGQTKREQLRALNRAKNTTPHHGALYTYSHLQTNRFLAHKPIGA